MDDLFYFSQHKIEPDELARILSSRQELSVRQFPKAVQSFYDGGFWDWYFMEEDAGDFNGFEPEHLDRILARSPATSLTVSFRYSSFEQLREVLVEVVTRFGGWVEFGDGSCQTFSGLNIDEAMPDFF